MKRALLVALATSLAAACANPQRDQHVAEPLENSADEVDTAEAPTPEPTRKTREQLREQARTDPDGADAEAISNMSRNELVATAINTAGFLCARVTDLYPQGGHIIAHCTEYRSGQGRVKYRIDTGSVTVEQLE